MSETTGSIDSRSSNYISNIDISGSAKLTLNTEDTYLDQNIILNLNFNATEIEYTEYFNDLYQTNINNIKTNLGIN